MNDLSSQLSPLDLYPSLKMSRQLDDLNMRWKLLQVFFWTCALGVGYGGGCSSLSSVLLKDALLLHVCYFCLWAVTQVVQKSQRELFTSVAWPIAFPFKLSQQFTHSRDCINLWRLVGTIIACFATCHSSIFTV